MRGETRRRQTRRRRTALDEPGGFGRESKIGRNHEMMKNKTFKVLNISFDNVKDCIT